MNFLTNRPQVSTLHTSGHLALSFFQDITDNNGITLQPVIKVDGVTKTVTIGTCDHLTQLHIPNTIYSSGKVMTVKLVDYLGADASLTYTFNIVSSCNSQTVAWLNDKGGIDHYTFISKSKSISSESETFESLTSVKTLKSKRYEDYELFSALEPLSTREWIKEIIGARLWIIPFKEVQLMEADFKTDSPNLEQMRIVVRPFRTKVI